MARLAPDTQVRLAELLAVLSLGADLGMGQPMEHAMRQSLIALRIADRLGLAEQERAVLYYVSLISWVGCHVDAYEQAKWFGDDLALKRDFRHVDMAGLAKVTFTLAHVGAGRPLRDRAKLAAGFLGDGRRASNVMLANHWYATDDLAARLRLGDAVRQGIYQTYERWDGKGVPGEARGEQVLLTSRIVGLADVLEVYYRAGGPDAAMKVARERSGTQFDPRLVELVCDEAGTLLAGLDDAATGEAVIAAEPALDRTLSQEELDEALEAVADYSDVKSPYTLGHSRAVADLAGAAATVLGLGAEDVTLSRRAGLVHDLGRLGVSNAVWDKRGPLTSAERERVRLHPYLTERMLASAPALATLGRTAGQHHERMDGSGYPRGVSGATLSPVERLLAAADSYRTKLEPRPHRAALQPDEAAAALRADVRAARLDGQVVDAVLHAAGHAVHRRKDWPAGLTTREVEVLRLLARGDSNREIARRLVISPRTAAHHVEHIYAKTGATNRARAGLFATRHGLMTAQPHADPAPRHP
jgi:HD-GYP domain-containing protein (c-di-GMP phosphodiesterase class II)